MSLYTRGKEEVGHVPSIILKSLASFNKNHPCTQIHKCVNIMGGGGGCPVREI